ncbi:MAG: enoyl-CoA hydratase-related protein [Actinomycetota bacterium]|jgi:crotonobetainyl-CoA hydratase|nr:MAG: caiD [Acidimicrobiaceae bacterium]
MSDGFRVERAGAVVTIIIDRPKANAIDATTSRAMGSAFAQAEADPDVRVVIVTGAGDRFFSAGWDLGAAGGGEGFDSDYGPGGFGGFPDFPDRTTPVIAAVNGMAVGGGFEIAMAADLIVAADHAQFFLPEAGLGILPDAGSVRLPALLPPHIAREMLLTGRRMSADEAARWGLVNAVVAGIDLREAAAALAGRVVASAPLSVAAILDIGRRCAGIEPVAAMRSLAQVDSYRLAIDSADAVEGTRAFAEKRPPVWRHH